MEILELNSFSPGTWKTRKKRNKTPPLKRLEKIFAAENDELESAYGKSFDFFCEHPTSDDYAFFKQMLGNYYSCYHIAFRYSDDWSEKDEAFTLTNPEVCLTHIGAWIVWLCYYASEATFAKELKASVAEDYPFEPHGLE